MHETTDTSDRANLQSLDNQTFASVLEGYPAAYERRWASGMCEKLGLEPGPDGCSDEDRVLRLSAAMYTEEMGENPMARDPDGYRRRVRMLISRGWPGPHSPVYCSSARYSDSSITPSTESSTGEV